MTNSAFVDRAFRERGPKLIFGFSRPFYHNLAGVLYGHRFDKGRYGGMLRHTEAAMLLPHTTRICRFWKLSNVYSFVNVSRYPAGKPTRSTVGAGKVCVCPTKKSEPIQLRGEKVSRADELIKFFNQTRQPKEQVAALEQFGQADAEESNGHHHQSPVLAKEPGEQVGHVQPQVQQQE